MTSRGVEKMNNDTIGVDVSKDHLDAHRLADGAARRFANDRGGHKALIKWLAQTPRYRVVSAAWQSRSNRFAKTSLVSGCSTTTLDSSGGWFSDSLPNAPNEKISVLRLDGDYYS